MEGALIVKANVKNHAKINDKALEISEEFYAKLQEKAVQLVKEACQRAKANNRNTLMARDL